MTNTFGSAYVPQLDATRVRSQVDTVREIMLGAGQLGRWLTLNELEAMTHFGQTSISACLRHLRKRQFGSYVVDKRRRGTGGLWEYQVRKREPDPRQGALFAAAIALLVALALPAHAQELHKRPPIVPRVQVCADDSGPITVHEDGKDYTVRPSECWPPKPPEAPKPPKKKQKRVIDGRYWTAIGATATVGAYDLIQGQKFVHQLGHYETDPLLGHHPSFGRALATGAAFHAGAAFVTYELKKRRFRAWWLPQAALVAAHAYGIVKTRGAP